MWAPALYSEFVPTSSISIPNFKPLHGHDSVQASFHNFRKYSVASLHPIVVWLLLCLQHMRCSLRPDSLVLMMVDKGHLLPAWAMMLKPSDRGSLVIPYINLHTTFIKSLRQELQEREHTNRSNHGSNTAAKDTIHPAYMLVAISYLVRCFVQHGKEPDCCCHALGQRNIKY